MEEIDLPRCSLEKVGGWLIEHIVRHPKKNRSPRCGISEKEYLRIKFGIQKPEKRRIRDHDKKRQGKKKKKKKIMKAAQGPEPPPDLPENLKQVVQAMGGHDLRLLIQKILKGSDKKKDQNRLSMPVNQLRGEDDFLTEEEKKVVLVKKDKRIQGIDVTFIESSLKQTEELSLRKWDFGGSISYVLTGNWYNVTKRIAMEEGDAVQVWFFRGKNRELCFILVRLPKENLASSSSVPKENQDKDNTQPNTSKAIATEQDQDKDNTQPSTSNAIATAPS